MRCKAKDVFEINKMFHEKVINKFKSCLFVKVKQLIFNDLVFLFF